MSMLDIAQARKGKARDAVGKAKAGVSQAGTKVEYGTATSSSADGYVEIIMDNGGSSFTVPCDSPINQGDRVSYISHAGQGKAVSLYGTTALAQQAYDNADDAAQAASDAAQAASDASDEAQAAMAAIDQHFWTDTDGVHVTQGSVKDETITGKNILINTLGVIFRNALAYLAQFTASGVTFFDGGGTSADHQTAQFTSTTARVGMLSQKHVTMNSNGIAIADGDYTQAMFNGGSIAFYDGTGNAASNITAQFGGSGARIGKASEQNIALEPNVGITFNDNGVRFADIHQLANGGGITLGANSLIRGSDTSTGSTMNLGVSGTSQAAINLEASSGTKIAGVYLNAANETVSVLGTVTLGTPLPVASGGTGATGVSSATTGTSVITVASGVTLQSATYRTWGKMAQVLIGVRVSSALAANATVTIGTIVSGKRPIMATQCGYISNDGYISTDGSVVIRNITGASIGTSTTIYTAATYLLA